VRLKVIFLSLLFLFSTAQAKDPLRWAADTESGAPYVFQDPRNPNRLMGFEYDIIQKIAEKLGREAVFVQNTWEGLVLGLQRNQYDVIINGIEVTEDRKREILFSDPYCVTFEQLTIRKDDTSIENLSDLVGKKVGTLRGSLAERILQQEGIEALGYEAETNAYEDLKLKRSDAVLLDEPIAQYYAHGDPELKMVGSPVGQILYGIGIQNQNRKLQSEINNALKQMVHSGELREIYDRWNLWTPTMASFFNDSSPTRVPPSQYEYFLENSGKHSGWKSKLALYKSFIPILAKGALTTLKISIASMLLAVILGLALALMRVYAPKPIAWASILYIEFVRGTPLLIQLFFIFYALPHIGITFSPFVAAVLGLGLNYAAYEAENYRAGIQAIPKAQIEAATALGFTKRHALRYVVLPQASRIVLPPITNDFISLLKDSSLVSVITMVELTKLYGQLASTYYDFLGTGVLVAIFYLLLGLPFVRLSAYVEKKFHYHKY
jgi:polar amino acid transport system substrate-binding protein